MVDSNGETSAAGNTDHTSAVDNMDHTSDNLGNNLADGKFVVLYEEYLVIH